MKRRLLDDYINYNLIEEPEKVREVYNEMKREEIAYQYYRDRELEKAIYTGEVGTGITLDIADKKTLLTILELEHDKEIGE